MTALIVLALAGVLALAAVAVWRREVRQRRQHAAWLLWIAEDDQKVAILEEQLRRPARERQERGR